MTGHKRSVLRFLAAVFTLAALLFCSAVGEDPPVDSKSIYENAKKFFLLGKYSEAADQFSRIVGYPDSENWVLYCKAHEEFKTADDYEGRGYLSSARECISRAGDCLTLLAGQEFEDAEKLKAYCTARSLELDGSTQAALEKYSGLSGVLDSSDRFLRLSEGRTLPTQAPEEKPLSFLSPVPASARKNTATYYGPGSSFVPQELIPDITALPAIAVCAEEDGFYMLEADTEGGKLRFWAPSLRIKPERIDTIHKIIGSPGFVTVFRDTEAFFGPGDGYVPAPCFVSAGTRVKAVEEEAEYTHVELTPAGSDKPVRVWIPTDALR